MKSSLRLILLLVLISGPAFALQDDGARPTPSPLVRLFYTHSEFTKGACHDKRRGRNLRFFARHV
jgi:hypothetical protein